MALRTRLMIALLVLATSSPVSAAPDADIPLRTLSDYLYYHRRGSFSFLRGDYRNAEQRFILAIKTILPYATSSRVLLANCYSDLALTLHHQGRNDDAEPLARWSLGVRLKRPSVEPQALYESFYLLGTIQQARGRHGDAETLLKRALTIQEKVYPAGDPTFADTLNSLADAERDLAKYDEAEPLYKSAIALCEQSGPSGDLELARTLDGYVVYLRRIGRDEEVKEFADRARSIRDALDTRQARSRPPAPRALATPSAR